MESRNRNDLANERTYLAYLRTALAFIAFGFVVARFALFAREISIVAHVHLADTHTSTLFGTGMAAIGIIVGLYGTARYVATKRGLDTHQASPMPVWAAGFGGIVVAAIGVTVAVALFAFR